MVARADLELSPAGHAVTAKPPSAQPEKSYPRSRRCPTAPDRGGGRCCVGGDVASGCRGGSATRRSRSTSTLE
ncbi:hypothetical protein [Lysobacter gummosus]|uniref:hypothetical protein n=1 Tax=Lysobacter gummosus TaxID=262324 RepID=UPI003634386A